MIRACNKCSILPSKQCLVGDKKKALKWLDWDFNEKFFYSTPPPPNPWLFGYFLQRVRQEPL